MNESEEQKDFNERERKRRILRVEVQNAINSYILDILKEEKIIEQAELIKALSEYLLAVKVP